MPSTKTTAAIDPDDEDADIIQYLSFGLDAGKTSGWALAQSSDITQILGSGVCKTAASRRDACIFARDYAEDLGLPLLVCAESWPGRWPSQKSAMGMGRAYGRWLDHIDLILGVRDDHILRTSFKKWRNEVYGPELCRQAKDEDDGYKRLACAFASVKDHNEAEAICITIWAQSSFEGVEAAEAVVERLRRAARAG